MAYLVLAKQFPASPEREVYRTDDAENASCMAESYFINRHAHAVRAVSQVGERVFPLKDQRGREFVWNRL